LSTGKRLTGVQGLIDAHVATRKASLARYGVPGDDRDASERDLTGVWVALRRFARCAGIDPERFRVVNWAFPAPGNSGPERGATGMFNLKFPTSGFYKTTGWSGNQFGRIYSSTGTGIFAPAPASVITVKGRAARLPVY
jgi:hypothetical protein